MLEHHIQRHIVSRLAHANTLTFSELQPDGIENKLFTYHLKITIREKLVEKTPDGMYRLTQLGKRSWKLASNPNQDPSTRALSVLILAVTNSKSEWLLYSRSIQPLKDQVGFMHAYPMPGQAITDTAKEVLHQKTGLVANFTIAGSGVVTMYSQNELESFTHMIVLTSVCEGELRVNDAYAEYFWSKDPIADKKNLLPNMPDIVSRLQNSPKPFFFEATYRL